MTFALKSVSDALPLRHGFIYSNTDRSIYEEFSQVVFGKLLTPVLCNCLETSKSAMHSSAAPCKAPKQINIDINGLACWTSNSKVVGSNPTGGEWVRN